MKAVRALLHEITVSDLSRVMEPFAGKELLISGSGGRAVSGKLIDLQSSKRKHSESERVSFRYRHTTASLFLKSSN